MDNLNWLLDNLLSKVPKTQCAVLLTVDGLKKNWAGINEDDADRLAATASSLCSLSNQIGVQLSGERSMRQVVVELADCIFFVTSASARTVVAVAADRTAEIRVLSYEIDHLCKQVAKHFDVQDRASASAAATGQR